MSVNTIYSHPSDNVAPIAAISVNTGVEDSSYPRANLVDQIPAKPAKLTGTTGSWVFDFGSARRVDLAAIIHHNLTAGLNVRIQGNATNVWGAPTLDAAFTIPTYHENGYPVNPWLDLTLATGYSVSGFQFWRLVVVGVNAAAVAIGEVLLLSSIRRFSPNIVWGELQKEIRPNVEHRTDYGVSTIYDLGVTIRELEGQLDSPDAQRTQILSWFRDARGRSKPFLLIPDGNVNDAWLVLHAQTEQDVTLQFLNRNDIKIAVREVGRGLFL